MHDMMKIVQTFEDFDILLKGVTKTIKDETKEQKGGFVKYFRSCFVTKSITRKRNCEICFWK